MKKLVASFGNFPYEFWTDAETKTVTKALQKYGSRPTKIIPLFPNRTIESVIAKCRELVR